MDFQYRVGGHFACIGDPHGPLVSSDVFDIRNAGERAVRRYCQPCWTGNHTESDRGSILVHSIGGQRCGVVAACAGAGFHDWIDIPSRRMIRRRGGSAYRRQTKVVELVPVGAVDSQRQLCAGIVGDGVIQRDRRPTTSAGRFGCFGE